MDFTVAQAFAAYKQTLDLARETRDTVVLETFDNDGVTEKTLGPDSIAIDPETSLLHISNPDGSVAEIHLCDAPILPAITLTKIRRHIESAKNAVNKLASQSPYLFLLHKGVQSNIPADHIRIDSHGFWLPEGSGFEWSQLSSINQTPKDKTGKNPELTIFLTDGEKIIFKT